MQQILTFIENQKQEFVKLPLFAFMQDKSIDPKQRLSFAPCMAHFIMSFSDLNKYVFRANEPANKIQKIINEGIIEFNPVADNVTLMAYPAAQRLKGDIAFVPVLGGSNSQEGRLVAGALLFHVAESCCRG